MRASKSWTKGYAAVRKWVAVPDGRVNCGAAGVCVCVCLSSDDGRTFRVEMTPDEADRLAAALTRYAARARTGAE